MGISSSTPGEAGPWLLQIGWTYSDVPSRLDCAVAGFKTKLSSAGLIYKHYGKAIVAKLMGLSEDHADVRTVYLATYKKFMEAIDAVDNGNPKMSLSHLLD